MTRKMGCDIHMVLEEKQADGTWQGVHDYDDGASHKSHDLLCESNHAAAKPEQWFAYWKVRRRNYELFAALAGVRGSGPEPRGLPHDISTMAASRVAAWDHDGHSHTWFTLRECGARFLAHTTPHKVLTPERYQTLIELFGLYYFDNEKMLDNFRVIIWFDN
jgi:hypothetical protein